MTLQPGMRVGPYEVLCALGAGGMGEVYRARDTKLDRDVAIKVLPEAFAGDADRLARFEREAKVLAALNHPNIASIHGIEQAGSALALVMELVEGEDLSAHIARGPMLVAEALPIAKQIAEALEAAHAQGIIHRDLKPANVKVRADGTVKVLDFGLAKLSEAGLFDVDRGEPTLTSPAAMTGIGVILGTAAYMAPEQARGTTVDKRADIWAFGVVLYEMLSGRRMFAGETVPDTLASVLTGTPIWERVPAQVLPLLRRCLEKDPKRRLRDIGDAMPLLEETPQFPAAAPTVRVTRWLWPGVAALLAVVLIGLAALHFRERAPVARQPARLQIVLPENVTLPPEAPFAVSPDGRLLVFGAAGPDAVTRLWIRPLGAVDARPLAGTEITGIIGPPFWSPDSRFVAFDDGVGHLKKIDVSGGPAQTVCDVPMTIIGGSWNADGMIILAPLHTGLMRVSSAGGILSPLTRIDASREEAIHVYPSFLPDGRRFLYLRVSSPSSSVDRSGVYIGSLDVTPEQQSAERLVTTTFGAAFVPVSNSGSNRGHLLFRSNATLMARPFDDRSLAVSGEPVPVAEQLASFLLNGFFSASTNGVLVYRTGANRETSEPTWFDRHGTRLGHAQQPGNFVSLALSPDGARAAAVGELFQTVARDLWLLDFAPVTGTRLTFGRGLVNSAIWSPDGSSVAFGSATETVADLFQKRVNSTSDEEVLLKSGGDKTPTSWSRDGRFLLYTELSSKTKNDVWVLPLESRTAMPLLNSVFDERQGRFAPDGRFIAYVSDESGRSEVYVREFSGTAAGAKRLVSTVGGRDPHWRGDGKQLFYGSLDGTIMVVDVTAGAVFQAGTPTPAFKLPTGTESWDVTADGGRFLVAVPLERTTQTPFTVVVNWEEALKR